MIDLEFWSNPFEHDKNFFATYWTTQNILVPIAEKEVMYKGWIYEIDEEEYINLETLRTNRGYNKDFCGKCRSKRDAQDINGFFIAHLKTIKNEIENCQKENRNSSIKKVRPI